MKLLVVSFLIGFCFSVVLSQEGQNFVDCVKNCVRYNCTSDGKSKKPLPFVLNLFFWSCEDNCKYECMDEIATNSEYSDLVKYGGKWPFKRVFGIQEILSVIFSLSNLIAGIIGYRIYLLMTKNKPQTSGIPQYIFLKLIIETHTWIWSILFHCRDLWWTERGDYLSAGSVIFYNLQLFIIFALKIQNIKYRTLLAVVFLAAYLLHYYYLCFIRFDYGFNLKVLVSLVVVYHLMLIVWGFINRNTKEGKFAIFFAFWATSVGLLEILDFPPLLYRSLDAHASWHLLSIPLSFITYQIFPLRSRFYS